MDTTKTITNRLFELQDKEYGDFSAKLTPTLPREAFIGVRVPAVRTLAKLLCKEGGYEDFLNTLPHQYYDENMLHGLLLSEMKDYNSCIAAVDKFLPYVATLPYIQNNRLDLWVHNKAIQKSRESYRISSEKKELLRSLKRES